MLWRFATLLLIAGVPAALMSQTQTATTRRSQRIRMPEVRVESPDERVWFTLLPHAERLTFTVSVDGIVVLEPSPLAMTLDGYELSTGVVFNGDERYNGDEAYPWLGAKSTATSTYNGSRIRLTNDLTSIEYTL